VAKSDQRNKLRVKLTPAESKAMKAAKTPEERRKVLGTVGKRVSTRMKAHFKKNPIKKRK
jgi:hypothetical protein